MKHPKANCDNCPLKDESFVPLYQPKIFSHKVLFIGQAPGEVEVYTKRPFTGPAGKTHWRLLKEAGLNKELMAHDNACSCYPGKGATGDLKPPLRAIECCFGRLKDTIHTTQPKLIIALGEEAMHALTGLSGITTHRSRVVELHLRFEYSCRVLIALHPSFVMRQRQWIPIQVQIYKQIEPILQGRVEEFKHPTFLLDPTPEELERYLDTTNPVGCDTETTGLDVIADSIIGMSFSTSEDSAAAVAFTGPDDPRWPVIKKFLEDPTKKKVWQNGSYDTSILRYSRNNPFKVTDEGFYYDTRLAQQLLNSDLPTDLDYLRAEYTQIPPYKPSKKERAAITTWGKQRMLEYAAWDAVTTLAVYNAQRKELSSQELELMENLLIPLVYTIGRMEDRGILVSMENLAAIYSQAQPVVEEVEQRFNRLGLNPRSPAQLKAYFQLKSTDEDTIQDAIKHGHPHRELLEQLLEFRKASKLLSTYIQGVVKRLKNGRIHTHFKIEGTGTGRLSSENPNLQNVPDVIRYIYIPDPGYVFLKGDHSQIELWVGAILADEELMINDLLTGVDIHYISCQLCFPNVPLRTGRRSEDFTREQISAAKAVVFGTFYGRSAYSIAREFGVSVATAEQWQHRLLNRYPGLRKYRERIEKEVATKGYLTTPFGRRRYINEVTKGYNFPVQSSASDITLSSLVETDRAGFEPVVSVHDDILFRVPENRFDEHFQKIKAIMTRPIPQLKNMSFKIDFKRGYNWYEMEDVE